MLTGISLWAWQQTRSELLTNLRVVAQFVADNALAIFDELGNDLPYLSRQLSVNGGDLAADYELLQTYQKYHPSVASMALFAPDGKMLLNTKRPFGAPLPDPRAQPSFRASLEKTLKSSRPWIGMTQYGLVLDAWRIPVRYVVRYPDGKPRYIIQAAVKLDQITSAWAHMTLPMNTAVGLIRTDGYHIARLPAANPVRVYSKQMRGSLIQELHRNPNEMIGTYNGRVQTDGSRRLGIYVHLSKFPVVAYASLSSHEIGLYWIRRITPFVSLGFISILGYIALAYLLIRREQQHATELTVQSKRQALTGLPNRIGAQEWIETQLNLPDATLSVLQIDLLNFKDINTALGTDAGDRVLQEIAERLRKHADRLNAFVSHLDADEFLLGLPGSGLINAHASAQAVRRKINDPYEIEGRTLRLQARIGIACIPEDAHSAPGLLRAVDAALHAAKRGQAGISFYDPETGQLSDARVSFQHAVERALEHNEFMLYYQPIVNLESGRLVGAEGLLRWQDPERGLLPPSEFIPLAEATGWIAPLGECVFRRACSDVKSWQLAGLDLYISVNLSASQFNSSELIDQVQNELKNAGITPRQIELEITETAVMEDVVRSTEIMRRLSTLGLRLAIDDFGTGYSSLAYLRKLPAQTIKIDQSFIRDIDSDPEDLEIVKAIVALARVLGLQTLAEGIETEAQYRLLRNLGVDLGQGYWFSRPVPEPDFRQQAAHWETPPGNAVSRG